MTRIERLKIEKSPRLVVLRNRIVNQIVEMDRQLDISSSCKEMMSLMNKQLHLKWKKREIERELESRMYAE